MRRLSVLSSSASVAVVAVSIALLLLSCVDSFVHAVTANQRIIRLKSSLPRRLVVSSATTTPYIDGDAAALPSKWQSEGLSQADLMRLDECIIVDDSDRIIGHASKQEAHRFTSQAPAGLLHRAFSVFLFNARGELLLQRRADSKITFPSVWTNTCCSHPLYGQTPNEVDTEEAVLRGDVSGIKNAAVRKLQHELGIDASKLQTDDFKFLTRLHYSAPSVEKQLATTAAASRSSSALGRVDSEGSSSSGDSSGSTGNISNSNNSGSSSEDNIIELSSVEKKEHWCWGESEVDYILFLQAEVDLFPNAEEVSEVRFVNQSQLQQMMQDPLLQWSPWFRIIAKHFLADWWKNLSLTLRSDTFADYSSIHKIM